MDRKLTKWRIEKTDNSNAGEPANSGMHCIFDMETRDAHHIRGQARMRATAQMPKIKRPHARKISSRIPSTRNHEKGRLDCELVWA
jgi:hypothetical protein